MDSRHSRPGTEEEGSALNKNLSTLNGGSQLAQLSDEVVIATVDELGTGNLSDTLGHKTGDDHGGTGAKVGGGNGRAHEALIAGEPGGVGGAGDGDTHADQLVKVGKAIFPDLLIDGAHALSRAEKNAELGLHVGRESGVYGGGDLSALQVTRRGDGNGGFSLLDGDSHLGQLADDGLQMLGDDVGQGNTAARSGYGAHIGAGFDHVGNNGVGATVQFLYAINVNFRCACTQNVSAAHIQEIGQGHDVGLSGGVTDDGSAFCQHGGQHDVDGSTYGSHVQNNLSAAHSVGSEAFKSLTCGLHLGTHDFKSTGMVVQRTGGTELASAGVGDAGTAFTTQFHTHQIGGGADLFYQHIGGSACTESCAVDLQRGWCQITDITAHRGQNFQGVRDVADIGDVFNDTGITVEGTGKEDGEGSVLHAADRDSSVQTTVTVNKQFFHILCKPVRHEGLLVTNVRLWKGGGKVNRADYVFSAPKFVSKG